MIEQRIRVGKSTSREDSPHEESLYHFPVRGT